ncbi:hypothetical protein EXIGLDRAFT_798589 [Exidia glandulosa HHB12029]|uniref:Uncharacterized protein n=1 Tax=Exidia glandulosa HHB12029 TaxID=1314781 RepID=A0A165N3N3_EXIGL|nr:hypothetical protein EXIGLDRAFT_798589 [Exidia glandulosa HHB12029]
MQNKVLDRVPRAGGASFSVLASDLPPDLQYSGAGKPSRQKRTGESPERRSDGSVRGASDSRLWGLSCRSRNWIHRVSSTGAACERIANISDAYSAVPERVSDAMWSMTWPSVLLLAEFRVDMCRSPMRGSETSKKEIDGAGRRDFDDQVFPIDIVDEIHGLAMAHDKSMVGGQVTEIGVRSAASRSLTSYHDHESRRDAEPGNHSRISAHAARHPRTVCTRLQASREDKLQHFTYHAEHEPAVVQFCIEIIQASNYPIIRLVTLQRDFGTNYSSTNQQVKEESSPLAKDNAAQLRQAREMFGEEMYGKIPPRLQGFTLQQSSARKQDCTDICKQLSKPTPAVHTADACAPPDEGKVFNGKGTASKDDPFMRDRQL